MSNGAVILQGKFPIPDDRRELLTQLATGLEPRAAAVAVRLLRGRRGGDAERRSRHPGPCARRAALRAAAARPALAPGRAGARLRSPSSRPRTPAMAARSARSCWPPCRPLGVQARVVKAGDYQPREIAKEKLLYIVISTHGDGDPPDEARGLYEFLGTKRAPQLPELQYSVLALGDSSYPKFCEAGRVVDERLAKLGAKRLLPRVDCDVDFEKLATTWADDALARVREHAEKLKPAGGVVIAMPHRPPRRRRRSPSSRARSRPPPKCWPTSASSGAARCAKCATWSSRSPASATSTSRATRWASCIAIRIRPSRRCSRRPGSMPAPPSRTKARRTRCSNGCATSAS